MQAYFTSMAADDNIMELSSLRKQLTNLKDDIETILNNLKVLTSEFDASNAEDAPSKPKKKK